MIIIVTLISFENSEKPEWLYKNQHQIFRLPSPAATPQPHTIMGTCYLTYGISIRILIKCSIW